MRSLKLRLPSNASSIAAACDHLEAFVRDAGWAASDVSRAVLAVGEAAGNAVEHGDSTSGFSLSIDFRTARLRVCVDDGGGGPDASALDRPSLPDGSATEGRGLYILSALVDRLAVEDGALCFEIAPNP